MLNAYEYDMLGREFPLLHSACERCLSGTDLQIKSPATSWECCKCKQWNDLPLVAERCSNRKCRHHKCNDCTEREDMVLYDLMKHYIRADS